MSYFDELTARGWTMPAGATLLETTDDAVLVELASGMVMGLNKCEFTFWRSRETVSAVGDFSATTKRELHIREPGTE